MGFMKDRATDAKAALKAGDTDRAAKALVHALLEGPTTRAEIVADLGDKKGRKG